MKIVSVLFARKDSIYKTMPECDVWDKHRDARNWPGGTTIVAHPPCRGWGNLRFFAKPEPGELELTTWAIEQIRAHGGVLEHPVRSLIFKRDDMPAPGDTDEWGGYTVVVDQFWWGHRAQKRTGLYICGCPRSELPVMPLRLGEATHTVGLYSGRDKARCRPSITKREREATPPEFAAWMVEVARRCNK